MFVLAVGLSLCLAAMASNVSDSFARNEIVPDVLASVSPSISAVTIIYSQQTVNLGNELTPTQVANKPSVQWKSQPGKLYTLIMTDPDAPSRANPVRREFKHWLVTNIPGDSVEKGHEVAGYVGAGPPQGTGLHRYVFLVYEQPGKLVDEENVASNSIKDRPMFKAAKWASEKNLIGPIAGNFFQAQYDDHVPKLHASFKKD